MREYGDNTRDPALDEALRRGRRAGRVEIVAWTAGLLCIMFLIMVTFIVKVDYTYALRNQVKRHCCERAAVLEAEGDIDNAVRLYTYVARTNFYASGDGEVLFHQATDALTNLLQRMMDRGESDVAAELVVNNWQLVTVLPTFAPQVIMRAAQDYADAGDNMSAIDLYQLVGSRQEVGELYYQEGESYLLEGDRFHAAGCFVEAAEFGSREIQQAAEVKLDEMRYKTPEEVPLPTIAAGTGHTVAVRTDGTVVAVGDDRAGQCRVSDWQGVLSVAAGDGFTLGLTESGDVLFTGENDAVESAVAGWKGVRRIAAGRDCAVALLRDGRVLVAGCDDPGWTDAVSVFAGGSRIGCIQTDGTVLLSGGEKQLNVSQWRSAVVLAMSDEHAVALLSDGSATGGGELEYGQSRVKEWTYRRTLAAAEGYTLGLLLDGTVRYAGNVNAPMLRARDWTGIVAIAAGETHAVGLREDGTVVAVGYKSYGQLNVSDWTDIRTPEP